MHLLGQTSNPLSAVITIILVITAMPSIAQDEASSTTSSTDSTFTKVVPEELWRAGVYFGLSRNLHRADHINGLPGVPSCCPDYTNGSGIGYSAGVLAEIPFADPWRVGWLLSLASYDGKLQTLEYEEVNANRALVVATFEHTIESNINAIGLESYIGYEVISNLKLRLGLRGDLLFGQNFSQQERLAAPEGITYETGRRTRLEFDGTVSSAAPLHGAVVGGIRYDLPINKNKSWAIAPEISGWYGLTDLIKDVPWSVHGLRLGVSLQYIARRIPRLSTDPVDLIVPIESVPTESTGSERETQ